MGTPTNRERIDELTQIEIAKLLSNTRKSKERWEQSAEFLVDCVASSYQLMDPYPISIERGQGAKIWDVDGNEYHDFMNGFGAMIQGHANPIIEKAVAERFSLGTHFGAPSGDAAAVASELARRFGLPKWRYTNSGSESTMDAIRIARATTGREAVLKIFGSYHGHHDAVMVDVGWIDQSKRGTRDRYASVGYGEGIPQSTIELTYAVPFNDAAAMEKRIHELDAEGRKPACVIMEAAMLNLGVVLPEPGYLEQVREITSRHGILLIFDEVKTGLSLGPGGATRAFGVTPDLLAVSKVLGAGLPAGAIGMTEEAAARISDGSVVQVGTYNGNPLVLAAARASLFEVLTEDAYEYIGKLRERMVAGLDDVIARYDLTAYTVAIGAKGCVAFSDTKVVDFESFWVDQEHYDHTSALTSLAWLFNVNRGVFTAPGREEEWTLSVAHDESTVDAYVSAFDAFASAIRA